MKCHTVSLLELEWIMTDHLVFLTQWEISYIQTIPDSYLSEVP